MQFITRNDLIGKVEITKPTKDLDFINKIMNLFKGDEKVRQPGILKTGKHFVIYALPSKENKS